jgi:hypothetical protein
MTCCVWIRWRSCACCSCHPDRRGRPSIVLDLRSKDLGDTPGLPETGRLGADDRVLQFGSGDPDGVMPHDRPVEGRPMPRPDILAPVTEVTFHRPTSALGIT